jgi:hypothetical protein
MTLSVPRVRNYLLNAELQKLFVEELGWDRHSAPLPVVVDGQTYALRAFAQKRGVLILECPPDGGGRIPIYDVRRKIEKQVARSAYEHLIIFADAAKTTQVWQWVARQPGQPAAYREHTYSPRNQSGDALIQKLGAITIPFSEAEAIDLTGAVHLLRDAFDRDRVTKRFYDHFKKEHAAFLGFVKGITDQADREWYASLMLNRLMFVYFIQKKGFLDGNTGYLRDRLVKVQQRKGSGKFQTFYGYFLLCLFHQGLSRQPVQRTLPKDLADLLGKVPYLNGGLFDVHELETRHEIDIPDEAFQRLFDFFDQYDWHLDARPLRNDREINPDVLGYIFEKYINQKQMGAYYTKEDITDYISKNTIIPHLFDVARKNCAIAFEPRSSVWRQLADNPDRYLFPSVRHGVIDGKGEIIPLPQDIQRGVGDVGQRDGWNRPAANGFGLPTETWREHVARRQRCLELREKLMDGQVSQVNDLITCNLDIRQFASDTIVSCEGPELLRAFYQTISTVTVLDPACGSGAFLFAALNVLQPLYEACLDRMQAFVDDLDRSGQAHSPKKFEDFRHILADVARHPNRDYFILKSIIVRNLYGVDIMEEAVEICKLRLFLKLVSQVESRPAQENFGLEPLPDIDFNIRPGNTLVGFARFDDVKRAVDLTSLEDLDAIAQAAADLDLKFGIFRDYQTSIQDGQLALDWSKSQLRKGLDDLRSQLDRYLAGVYDVDPDKPRKFAEWRDSHQPFHWFAEFYGIMSRGGFDVVIGNPPWKEYASVRSKYTVQGFLSEPCGNLHGLCTERALAIRANPGRMSFIVQMPLTCSSRMGAVRKLLVAQSSELLVVPFDDRPGKLFDGLQHCRSVIFLSSRGSADICDLFTTRYQRWPTEARSTLFAQFEYAKATEAILYPGIFPKYATDSEVSVFRQFAKKSETTIGRVSSIRETKSFLFYQEATQYWVKATIGLPYYAKNGVVGAPAHGRYVYFDKPRDTAVFCAILNSSLFYAYFIAYGDCFHLSETLVAGFPIPSDIVQDERLAELGRDLHKSLTKNAVRKVIQTRDGSEISYAEFYASGSKELLDEIDQRLAAHYGFSADELDLIINYDIKYRMGQEETEDDE